ncbi:MAG: NRDE family protein [Terriglobales bacterium]
MCTLSFIPERDGYLVGMNRDEQIARPPAIPPERLPITGGFAIYPREQSGGTWIAANSLGITLALLNWYSAPSLFPKSRSRGEVIPRVIAAEDSASVHDQLIKLDLQGTLPFRLVGIFSTEKKITEWRWNQRMLEIREFPWERHHWFSSGISDVDAEKIRGTACSASAPNGRPTQGWLRELHRSHENGPGPFSICVHRPEVRSLSYSEVMYSGGKLSFHYHPQPPCELMGTSK